MKSKFSYLFVLSIVSMMFASCGSYQVITIEEENPDQPVIGEGGVFAKKLTRITIEDGDDGTDSQNALANMDGQSQLYKEAMSWIGTPYLWGGNTRSGIDCSGFVNAVYKACGKTISRTAATLCSISCKVIKKSQLREGDLVFFRTDGKKTTTPNHVGMYLSDNKFIHASSSKGVTVADLTAAYYVKYYLSAGRVKEE